MKIKSFFIILFLTLAFYQCGGSEEEFTPLKKPVAIALSTQDVQFKGVTTRLAYVVDQFTQSIVVIDTLRHGIVDTADKDEFVFTPLPIGGEPVAVAVDDGVTPHRIFVADQFSNEILAYEIEQTIPASANFITFSPLALGSVEVGKSSRSLFKNAGSGSSPTLTNIVVDPDTAQNESWKLTFRDDGKYNVQGSKSGIQTNLATQGGTYSTDNGDVEFFISAGGERTSEGDQFFFSTFVAKPLQLADSPVDLLIEGRKLYILTKTNPSIIEFDLDTLTMGTPVAIPAVGIPTRMFFNDGKIYLSNRLSGNIFVYDTSSSTFTTTIFTGLTNIKFVAAHDDLLLILSDDSLAYLTILNLTTADSDTLTFNDFGNSIFISQVDNDFHAFIPNVAGNVDVVNLSTKERVDTNLDGKADFVNPQFFDELPQSTPELITVNIVPNKAHSETWQMIYEGNIPNVLNLTGTLTGDQLTDSAAAFQTNGVQAGDMVTAGSLEFEIESVDSETTLTLNSTPSLQGNVTFDVRSNGSYILIGSKSGIQNNRVIPGQTYHSDDNRISLKTRPSLNLPETRGDFFTFETLDPIDPIIINNQSMAVSGVGFSDLSSGNPIGYVLEQTSGQIAVMDLKFYGVLRIF